MTSGIDATDGRDQPRHGPGHDPGQGLGPGLGPGLGHGLGPHVVGTRVVVRRRLPGELGPSGGPALTDLLGVCVAWDRESCVVQPATGPPVRIALADIVSGKPVPPRPSPRLRVSPAEAQRRALAMWPDLETAPLGDWVLRTSATAANRRANSVLAIGDPGRTDPLAAVLGWYAARGRRPLAAVLADGDEAARFERAGWVPESSDPPAHFLVAGPARVLRAARATRSAAPATVGLDVDPVTGQATARVGERASGVGSHADGWLGVGGLVTAPAHRRQGLGLAVLAALVEWGAEQGAETVYLQVLADNTPALALYERLGFAHHHTYRYLAAPPAEA